ncbi:MAG: hypothetical protein IJ925_04085, partial [Muribaculaceae bacterium]|nr:hypothetical protein [Muribaculaceae bacterium]
MIQSMTGFGKATLVVGNKKLTAEIKSLNSKQMDLQVKLPLVYRELELELRTTIAKELHRGKVDVYVTCESIVCAGASQVNIEMLKSYKRQVDRISQEMNLPEPQDWYSTLFRMPDVFKQDVNEDIPQEELDAVRQVVEQSLSMLVDFRSQEGEKLYTFFKEKIAAIQHLLDSIEPYEQVRIEKIKSRILESLHQLEKVDYDKNR